MADETLCYPWWHAIYAPLRAQYAVPVPSGFTVNADGNVPANPETLRAAAEKQLRQRGLDWPLSLDAYSLARNISTEVGSGSIEEMVALGETTQNQARRRGRSVYDLIVNPQGVGHPNRGFYGNINKRNAEGQVVAAGTGRWTASSKDPTLMSIAIANLVLSGQSGDFTRGADDQDGPDAWAPQGQAAINNFVRHRASNNQYWIGPLPGIDHWHTFLQITVPGISPSSPAGQKLIQRGIDALQLPVTRPSWPENLPICTNVSDGTSPGRKMLIGAAILAGAAALLGGAFWFSKQVGFAPVSSGKGKTPKRLSDVDEDDFDDDDEYEDDEVV